MLKVGTKYYRVQYQSFITIKEVITHKKESGGKRVKLEREQYKMEYERLVAKGKTQTTQVKMLESDILAEINYGLWKLQ